MNVLIVDDLETNRKLLRAVLEGEDLTIFSAADGVEALQVLDRDNIDAVVSDILMPRMDGYRLCLELRKIDKFKTMPFIVYSSTYTSPSDEKTAMDVGADAFLRKPTPTKRIVQTLQEAVENKRQRRTDTTALPPEPEVMKQYNASLVYKLEEKNDQLEMQAQAMLRVQEQLYLQAAALEAAANAILIMDQTGSIQWVNPAFCALTGYTAEEVFNKNARFLRPENHDPTIYSKLWETIQAGHTWRGELSNCRKNGTIFIADETIAPVRSSEGIITHFVGIMNDLTSRKQIEAQFIEAQKMEVVGQLAGGVAHDFNNMLAVIMGYSDLMLQKLAPGDEHKGYVETIRASGERASALTRQLLIFSRKQTVEPVVLDINEVVQDLDKMLRRLLDENIDLTILPGPHLGRVKADSGYVGQVLMNLVVNARHAMPDGGHLTVATENIKLDEATASGAGPGNYVMISVRDTGTGMTEEVKARIFEAFFTTKPKGKGTGLGLATCQTIMQQSGGHIVVQSELGKGTTFKIYFPRVDQPLAVVARSADEPVPRGTETLLVVEDEPSLRKLVKGILQTQGYEALSASNGQEALQIARDHKGSPIRLVITDVVMPVMGGKAMVEWLKTSKPDLKIIFTSGYTNDEITQEGMLEEGVQFLSKPYTPRTLACKVREMLDAPT
jgi:two-component system cell cycle sensor histidine kinase/response regulator CckA